MRGRSSFGDESIRVRGRNDFTLGLLEVSSGGTRPVVTAGGVSALVLVTTWFVLSWTLVTEVDAYSPVTEWFPAGRFLTGIQ